VSAKKQNKTSQRIDQDSGSRGYRKVCETWARTNQTNLHLVRSHWSGPFAERLGQEICWCTFRVSCVESQCGCHVPPIIELRARTLKGLDLHGHFRLHIGEVDLWWVRAANWNCRVACRWYCQRRNARSKLGQIRLTWARWKQGCRRWRQRCH